MVEKSVFYVDVKTINYLDVINTFPKTVVVLKNNKQKIMLFSFWTRSFMEI